MSIVINCHDIYGIGLFFRIETIDGTAEATSDYKPLKKTMVFEPKETLLSFDIEIIDDNTWEPDEVFFIRMTIEPEQQAVLGKHPVTQVTILNDDGIFSTFLSNFTFILRIYFKNWTRIILYLIIYVLKIIRWKLF